MHRILLFFLTALVLLTPSASAQETMADTLEVDSVAQPDTVPASPVLTSTLDSVEVSLITCSPGPQVYELYGHTAIRCIDYTAGVDVVFNYGVFNFAEPHFLWRFLLGDCRYMVQPVPWDAFWQEYAQRGSSITSQTLNLTPEEANALFQALIINSRPENRYYQYNFLYNNCTTMVRDRIEQYIDGQVVYQTLPRKMTYRQILHHYTQGSLWAQEGNDLLIGADVDTILSDRAQMFAPEFMMNYADSAVIRSVNGDTRPLVLRRQVLVAARPVTLSADGDEPFPLSPSTCGMALLAVCLCVVGAEQMWRRMWWGWDILLMTGQGVAGLLATFMFCFSAHPAVGSNWQIWVLNPLPLLLMPWVVRCAWRRQWTWVHYANFAVLTLFLAFSAWIPQHFCQLMVPLALSLLTRPISYYLYYRRNNL